MVGVLKTGARWAWEVLQFVFFSALTVLVIGLLVFAAGKGVSVLGRAYGWAAGSAPCGSGSASVTNLLADLEGGALPARRAAIRRLRCAAPADLVEFDRLVLAARGAGRRRLRAAALEALARAEAPALRERASRLAGHADPELAAAGLAAARAMGVPEDDPLLAGALGLRPHWGKPKPSPEEALSPEAAALFSARAARVEEVLARADLGEFPARKAAARRAAALGDIKEVEALLLDPGFIVGGATAGEALAPLGAGFRPRAKAMADGDDPVLRDVGLGFLVAEGGLAPGAQAQGRSGR